MAAGPANWVWQNSRAANGSLIVLLAIADECGDGEFTEMSIAYLSRKCRLSDKGARRAVKDLEGLGELSVEPHRGGVSRYAPRLTPVKTTGPHPGQNDRPVKMSPRSKRPDLSEEPQVSSTPVKTTGPEITDVLKGSVVSGRRSRSRKASETPRPDVERLCEYLASRIEGNGSKRPNITKRWKDAARLLLDADGRTEEQVHTAIDWSQDHEFWRSNILSMPKLREKYDQLRLQATHEHRRKAAPAQQKDPDEQYTAALQRIKARKEAANGTGRDGDDRPLRQVALPAAEDR